VGKPSGFTLFEKGCFMTQATWEKVSGAANLPASHKRGGRVKFMIGGVLILIAVVYLIISGTTAGAQYFITVDEVINDPSYVGKPVRISGAVIGDTINYDSQNLIIEFTIANIPREFDDLAWALYEAVNDPSATRLPIYIENQVKPDLLQHEAQAILTGTMGEDGVFRATELLLKCPSRFQEAGAEQAISGE